ncbi:lamin-like protein [Neltuma alba]|uniref:lamin-like protein n=1 Tax=Neltuma alba TaxID=207710 RepID=UPI0010A35E2D|nr:lamin-like protein [Prosopis alba]
MGNLKKSLGLFLVVCAVLVMLPEASATRWTVGGKMGWSPNVNYTIWARGKHFYNGDWLFFVYDRNQQSVLEVNKTNYETCNTDHPLHNYTTGAGRDVAPLNVTRDYYFVSGNGFCYGGMKVHIHVEKPPPPPMASPEKAASSTLSSSGHVLLLPLAFAIGVAWDAFLRVW